MAFTFGRFVYAHLPKTGGTWLHDVLQAHAHVVHRADSHCPIACVPSKRRLGRAGVGTIRDPWSWYASWYRHALRSPEGVACLRAWGRGSPRFDRVLAGALRPDRVDALPLAIGGFWSFPRGFDPRPSLRASGLSLYRWLVAYTYGGRCPVGGRPLTRWLLHTGRLPEGLERLLGERVPSAAAPPVNTWRPGSALDLSLARTCRWSRELTSAVERVEGALARRLGYAGPGTSAADVLSDLDEIDLGALLQHPAVVHPRPGPP